MRLLMMLVIIFLGRGTSAQSCNNATLLGCSLDPRLCSNGAGSCKDCCRSELGEVEMSSTECDGQCKCCGVPDCTVPLCGCGPGYTTVTVSNPTTHCAECSCIPDGSCIEGSTWALDSINCNSCTCIGGFVACTERTCPPELCPQVDCHICKTNEKQVSRIDIFGCSTCICEQCPEDDCPIYCPPNQQVVYGDVDGCPICTCGQCPASICGCSPNYVEVEVLLPSGCKGCQCVPKQGSLCSEVQCPLCNGGQNELHGVGEDGCPFCFCGGSCIEGSTWKQDCNTCTCSNGIVVCTEIGCLPPAPCPTAVCPQCLQGEAPFYTEDPATGCVICSCSQVERCVEGHSLPADDGCNTCTCLGGAFVCTLIDCSPLECPEVDCPICSTNEKQAFDSGGGCPVCYCEPCPQPFCQCSDGLTPVLEYHETDCPTCGCVSVQPEPCPRPLCGCAPGFDTVATVQSDGCPGCACVGRPGGVGNEKPANEETENLLKMLQGEIEKRLGEKLDEFTLIRYATQVVSGINYFAKVQIASNPDKYIHIRVYHQSWTNTLELTSMQKNKTLNDAVVYF